MNTALLYTGINKKSSDFFVRGLRREDKHSPFNNYRKLQAWGWPASQQLLYHQTLFRLRQQ